jgi:arylsulfatase
MRDYLPDHAKILIPEFSAGGRPVREGNHPSIMPGPADTYASYGVGWANASNTPFRLYKHWVHEGGIGTPLIAHWPGVIQAGSMTHQTGQVIDIMATCLDVAGANYPETHAGNQITPLEGKSLLPIFQGRTRAGHEAMYWEHEGNRAVRQGQWKLVSKFPGDWELYDLEADRTELNYIAAQDPERVASMNRLYHSWAERSGVEPWKNVRPGR